MTGMHVSIITTDYVDLIIGLSLRPVTVGDVRALLGCPGTDGLINRHLPDRTWISVNLYHICENKSCSLYVFT